MTYRAPTTDMRFVLENLVDLEKLSGLDPFGHIDPETVEALLGEAARFTEEVIAPLGPVGDTQGSRRTESGSVVTPDGYSDAYAAFVASGWPTIAFTDEWGGGSMPWSVAIAVQEMVTSADMAFSLAPMLTYGAIEMLLDHGDDAQKASYLPKLVSGEWTGTMALTEPHAGSDLGVLSAKAEPTPDGSYRLSGTKIFITWGEHDLTDNIIHIVLARTPEAPPGTKGLSCFIVPKILDDGAPNDVQCVSIEHKIGIHASPTAVLSFGEREGGAVGYLVGDEGHGMRYMFTMMNNARLQVGLEGLAVAERALQQSATYATERIQGRTPASKEPVPIIEHADVRRTLMSMKAQIEAMRAVMYKNAEAIDLSHHAPDPDERAAAGDLASILTPISKAWGSDLGVRITSDAIQVHGGSGYIEETGVARFWRDSRIAPIYEGTNGIQAIDLATRKVFIGNGSAIRGLIAEMRQEAASSDDRISGPLMAAVEAVDRATTWLLEQGAEGVSEVLAGATPYLELMGTCLGGWLMAVSARAAEHASGFDEDFLADKVATAHFYAEHILTRVPSLVPTITAGSSSVFSIDSSRIG